ncbi:LysR family transcriptional regulator [Burkholderia sp. MSMB1589WGS]|uniref:LysR family transcriptional regulator n=1 Tax=Burkholderia sp. MSMB1589WGS TaxID=1636425 RepID=UPI0007B7C3C9|nr:LysR family transcriptional regulator [Burkholderia sp. MSMB1589WGS]
MNITRLNHLQGMLAFVHAVSAGSFTAAAARMGVSKSAVGKSVAKLEAQLGVRLFDRTTRSLGLTTEGSLYYASCAKILDELAHAESALAHRRQQASGPLRVSLPVSFGRRWVLPVLLDVAERHPLLRLDLSFTDRPVDLVDEGIDLAVRIGDPGDSASLACRGLGRQRSVPGASPAYFARRGRPRTPEQLREHDCIVFARDGRVAPWLLADDNGSPLAAAVRAAHTIGHGDALLDAAVAGLGIAYLSTWLAADALRAGRLETVLAERAVDDMPINVLWPHSRALAPKVRVTVDALVGRFTPAPPWAGDAA